MRARCVPLPLSLSYGTRMPHGVSMVPLRAHHVQVSATGFLYSICFPGPFALHPWIPYQKTKSLHTAHKATFQWYMMWAITVFLDAHANVVSQTINKMTTRAQYLVLPYPVALAHGPGQKLCNPEYALPTSLSHMPPCLRYSRPGGGHKSLKRVCPHISNSGWSRISAWPPPGQRCGHTSLTRGRPHI